MKLVLLLVLFIICRIIYTVAITASRAMSPRHQSTITLHALLPPPSLWLRATVRRSAAAPQMPTAVACAKLMPLAGPAESLTDSVTTGQLTEISGIRLPLVELMHFFYMAVCLMLNISSNNSPFMMSNESI